MPASPSPLSLRAPKGDLSGLLLPASGVKAVEERGVTATAELSGLARVAGASFGTATKAALPLSWREVLDRLLSSSLRPTSEEALGSYPPKSGRSSSRLKSESKSETSTTSSSSSSCVLSSCSFVTVSVCSCSSDIPSGLLAGCDDSWRGPVMADVDPGSSLVSGMGEFGEERGREASSSESQSELML